MKEIKEKLNLYDIGGLGNVKYKTIRFNSYRTGQEDGKLTIYAIYEPKNPPKFYDGYPSGQQMLVKLCNLHNEICELSDEEAAEVIVEWCKKNIHPYYHFTDTDYVAETDKDPADTWDMFINALECYYVHVKTMRSELEKLYTDTMKIFALKSLMDGDEYQAKQYLKDVDFENKDDMLYKWNTSSQKHKPLFYQEYLEKLPVFPMRLQMDLRQNKMVFEPEVKSVIDSAYYGLVRFMAVNADILNDDGEKNNLAFCEACGKLIIKKSNRQKYCDNIQCQSVRNQRKSRAYYQKNKA